jgi:hypothetical protein
MFGLLMRPLSIFGREPPERAMVNLPFLFMESLCAFSIKIARELTSSSEFENEIKTGGLGG